MPRKSMFSHTISKKVGGISIGRGNHQDYGQMVMWDHVPDCRGEECPAYRKCHYITKDVPGSPCYVIKEYQKAVITRIYAACGTEITSAQSMRIGLELLPLFKLLIRLKLEEAGLVGVVYTTPKGVQAVHPVFKEIRDTVKAIESCVASIGIQDIDISMNLDLNRKTMRDPQHPNYYLLKKAGEGALVPAVPVKSYYEMLEASAGGNLKKKEPAPIDVQPSAADAAAAAAEEKQGGEA